MSIRGCNIFKRPTSLVIDDFKIKPSSTIQVQDTDSSNNPMNLSKMSFVTLSSPQVKPQYIQALYQSLPPDFNRFLAYSRTDMRYYPIDKSLAESHMEMFQRFEDNETAPYCHSQNSNRSTNKNRYSNIFPNQAYRVKLGTTDLESPQDVSRDYINASNIVPLSNIPGISFSYIASQAPLPATIVDTWRMIWEQHVELTVMLTKFQEGRGGEVRTKAIPYWPQAKVDVAPSPGGTFPSASFNSPPIALNVRHKSRTNSVADNLEVPSNNSNSNSDANGVHPDIGSSETYGNLHVLTVNVDTSNAGMIIRTFKVTNLALKATLTQNNADCDPQLYSRNVSILHYLDWPDFGIPKGMEPLFNLFSVYRKLRVNTSVDSPIMVHCSAGVGRTGCFIAIDQFLDYTNHKQVEAVHAISMASIRLGKGLKECTPEELSLNGVGVNAILPNGSFRNPAEHVDSEGHNLTLLNVDLRLVIDIVLSLRACRHGMIQTKEQYALVYTFLQYCAAHPVRKQVGLF